MPEYIFQGSLTYDGVDFYVIADSEEEAVAMAMRGKYDHHDRAGAESTDWYIEPKNCVLNE